MEKTLWHKQLNQHKYELITAILLLLLAGYVNNLAGNYADKKVSKSVPDIILDNIPSIDLSYVYFVYVIIIAMLILYPLIFRLNSAAFIICQFALLVLIRSFFISITHFEPPVNAIQVNWPIGIFQNMDFKKDYFFSGHVAISFLGFLAYRKIKPKLSIIFLVSSFILAVTVLFMHLHYSIDVFAAFFIAYGSYKIGSRFFKKFNHE